MKFRNATICAAAIAAMFLAAGTAGAQEASGAPTKTVGAPSSQQMIPSLAVLNSKGATIKDGVLTMTGVGPSSIVFADRPWRTAGHVATAEFIGNWGKGEDSFAKDPPNATISVLSGGGDSVEDAVIELTKPKLDGDTLTFQVSVLEGDLKGAEGPASLFIDWFAVRGPAGGVAVGRVGWYHRPAAFAAGVAVGAAAASPYYHPYCGYYPYPPCY